MKSAQTLREHSVEHLLYEIQMLQETAKRLLHDPGLHHDATLKNATVESCVLHARVLTEFLYPDNARRDDVTSYDYVVDQASWVAARETIPAILTLVITRTGKEIAHLTMERRPVDDPEKPWPLPEIIEALHVALKKFMAHAAPDRLDSGVARYIAGLRPPMETVTITRQNSLSTGLATMPFAPDVSTVAAIPPWPGSSV
jgi:hypothetical protein